MTTNTDIIVFGAGGRAGRAAVAEARRRGLAVTAVVRDPAKHTAVAGAGVTLLAGDVTDPRQVARLAAGHAAAISAVYDPAAPVGEFFAAAAAALTDGLTAAGVGRLVAVGIGTVLEAAPGVALSTTDGFPEDVREFSAGHAAELPILAASELDWLVLAPPPVVIGEGPGAGGYRLGGAGLLAGAESFTYADLASALVDEATAPTRSRELVAVG
jgi:putative NADH-flavin reductase